MNLKRPAKYRAPLKKKEDIVQHLLSRPSRQQWPYRPGIYLFCWDVKIRTSVYKWSHFEKEIREVIEGYIGARWLQDADFMAEAQLRFEAMSDADHHVIYSWAIDDMQSLVLDGDCYKTLWSGQNLEPAWTFSGRSGGWLCLEGLWGCKFNNWDLWDYECWLREMDYQQLVKTYQFMVQCDADFTQEVIDSEFRSQMAFAFKTHADLEELTDELKARRAVCVAGDGI